MFLIWGCKKNDTTHNSQKILFQFEYINHAWGYQHHGYFIDSDGNVLKYSDPEDWNFPESDFKLSADKFAENLEKCILTDKKITADELAKYSGYINNIAASKVSAIKHVEADAGSSIFMCYKLFDGSETFKGYVIKMEGDSTCENLNFYSKKVILWLKDIGNSITDK